MSAEMNHFTYYSEIHIFTLIGVAFFIWFGLHLPSWIPKKEKGIAQILGVAMGVIGLLEIYYRIVFEGYSWPQVAPLHFCSVSMWAGVFYFLTQRDLFFQIAYYFSFGALLALILPGIGEYKEFWYVVLFMGTHGFVLLSVFFGIQWLSARPTLGGLKIALGVTALLFGISFSWNSSFFTNFMFTKNYLIDEVRFLKPFELYQFLLILSFVLMISLLYLPFKTKKSSCMKKRNEL